MASYFIYSALLLRTLDCKSRWIGESAKWHIIIIYLFYFWPERYGFLGLTPNSDIALFHTSSSGKHPFKPPPPLTSLIPLTANNEQQQRCWRLVKTRQPPNIWENIFLPLRKSEFGVVAVAMLGTTTVNTWGEIFHFGNENAIPGLQKDCG